MSKNHVFETVVDQLSIELNNRCTEYGFKKKVTLKLSNLKQSVEALIGPVLIAENKHPGRGYASIHLNKNWYSNSTRYKKNSSYRIFVERAYRGLLHFGYLSQAKAGVSRGSHGLYLTRYRATPDLLKLFDSKSLAELPVVFAGQSEVNETIRVQHTYQKQIPTNQVDQYRQPKTRTVKYTELIEYEDTDQTNQMRHNLQLINDRIMNKWIDLELSREEYTNLVTLMAKRNKDQLEENPDDYRPLMLSKLKLYRVFNDSHFQTGGRFYGGWWQEIPSEYRDRIVIDGKRTVQLDYSGLHPHILYREKSLELDGDPYDIGLTPNRNPEDTTGFRKMIKQCFNAMLNADKWMQRAPRGSQLGRYGVTWKQIVNAIKAKHPAIADQFFSGAGLRLQRIDSDLAEEIMVTLIQRCSEIVVLPVHDSFIVHHGYETELREAMADAYFQKYGAMPKLKASDEMRVESTGVPDLESWNRQSANDDSLLDLLELSESIPNERRLNLFRSRP